MARHSHKHTHQVVDGNGHPIADHGHTIIEHGHDHEDGPTPDASRHHNYTEEPAVAAIGPITPGQWMLADMEHEIVPGMEDPGEPGHPAYIYVTRAGQEVVIAYIAEPTYMDPGTPDRMDDPGEVETGDWAANAKLLTFSPALLRFVQKLAGQEGGGVIPFRDEALRLIEQLNQVEVRNDADRW